MRRYRRDGTPYPDSDAGLIEWAKDFEDFPKRIVRQETLPNGYYISTVWLGLDHRWDAGPPLIFETMVWGPGGECEEYMERYSTENDAILGHIRACDKLAQKTEDE